MASGGALILLPWNLIEQNIQWKERKTEKNRHTQTLGIQHSREKSWTVWLICSSPWQIILDSHIHVGRHCPALTKSNPQPDLRKKGALPLASMKPEIEIWTRKLSPSSPQLGELKWKEIVTLNFLALSSSHLPIFVATFLKNEYEKPQNWWIPSPFSMNLWIAFLF